MADTDVNLNQALTQIANKINDKYAKKDSIIDNYNDLNDVPISLNSDNDYVISNPFMKKTYTSSTFDPINEDIYIADKENKYGNLTNDRGNVTGTCNTKIGDTIFVFIGSNVSGVTYTSNLEEWEQIYNTSLNNYSVGIFSKKATSDAENFNISASLWYGAQFYRYISISNVDSYTITQKSISNGQKWPTLSYFSNDTQSYPNPYLKDDHIDLSGSTISSNISRYFGIDYCGSNDIYLSGSSYAYNIVAIDIVFNQEIDGVSNAYKFSGTYSKVESTSTFDSGAIYYKKGIVKYDDSEIVIKSDIDSRLVPTDGTSGQVLTKSDSGYGWSEMTLEQSFEDYMKVVDGEDGQILKLVVAEDGTKSHEWATLKSNNTFPTLIDNIASDNTKTFTELAEAIIASDVAVEGTSFLGGIKCEGWKTEGTQIIGSDKTTLKQCEMAFQVINSESSGKVIHFDVYSADTAPYHWTCIYWENGTTKKTPWVADGGNTIDEEDLNTILDAIGTTGGES